jgi:hypothetical protein
LQQLKRKGKATMKTVSGGTLTAAMKGKKIIYYR